MDLTQKKGVTISRQLMDDQRAFPAATGALTTLLADLAVAGKIINAEVNMAGLADILGQSGRTNVQGEAVQKLDVFANKTVKRRMEQCGQICVMASEEEEGPCLAEPGFEGNYTIAFDPLDGSSNIDVNVSVGTIFSIHRRLSAGKGPGEEKDLLQAGSKQVAAGYIIYGSSTMMVYTSGSGVHGFTLDPSVGEFFLSHPNMRFPEQSKYYSINEAYAPFWDETIQNYINFLKNGGSDGRAYSSRYIGSLVADFHRNLVKGGIFLYPRDKHDKSKPEGKLRLLYEAAPMAMLAEQAGGRAITDEGQRILDLEPKSLHQRVPLITGAKHDVDMVEHFLRGERPSSPSSLHERRLT